MASADRSFRQRLAHVLAGLRWQVREAEGGAQAWTEAEAALPEAVIVDSWLPDLDLGEFLGEFKGRFPEVDLVTAAGDRCCRKPSRALSAGAALRAAPLPGDGHSGVERRACARRIRVEIARPESASQTNGSMARIRPWPCGFARPSSLPAGAGKTSPSSPDGSAQGVESNPGDRLPELVGNAACMLEVSRRVRLVAPRMTPVLIEGPTGSGKEFVAEALHRLSTRSRKPFVAINCAAIPEALLEAELFGHTRGAFTGAVQGRIGRIEAADGGTLFLDEIGEMPLALQAKLLRFVECGELQRVGDNETVRVDVRILPPRTGRWPSMRRMAASAPIFTTGWRSFSSARRPWPSMPRICLCSSSTSSSGWAGTCR